MEAWKLYLLLWKSSDIVWFCQTLLSYLFFLTPFPWNFLSQILAALSSHYVGMILVYPQHLAISQYLFLYASKLALDWTKIFELFHCLPIYLDCTLLIAFNFYSKCNYCGLVSFTLLEICDSWVSCQFLNSLHPNFMHFYPEFHADLSSVKNGIRNTSSECLYLLHSDFEYGWPGTIHFSTASTGTGTDSRGGRGTWPGQPTAASTDVDRRLSQS